MIYSDFLDKVNEGYTFIPIIKEISDSSHEAIDIYSKYFDKKKSFFFESLEGDKNWSRYTIIGCSSGDYIEVYDNDVYKYSNFQITDKFNVINPLEWIQRFFLTHKIYLPDSMPPFSGGLVGHFSFDSVCYFENSVQKKIQKDTINAPDISLIICNEFIVFDKSSNKIFLVIFAEPNEISYKKCFEKLDEYNDIFQKKNKKSHPLTPDIPLNIKYEFEREDFIDAVHKIKSYIKSGDVMQVVLSQRMSINFKEKPIDFYKELRQINPSPYMYYLNMGDYTVVGSSPEILVRLENKKVTVRPIAGTRPRGSTPDEDNKLEIDLKNDTKELAEHLMLIDLGRNDIGRICKVGSVNLTDKMIIEKYSHVMHMVSNVEADIKDNLNMFDVLQATFPAGTVSGAPKIRALQIIYELENIKRGIYAGAIGYLGWNGNMDTAIAIRTCVIKDDELSIQCGAGVVYDSVPENEWDETINKGMAIIRAVEKLRGIK